MIAQVEQMTPMGEQVWLKKEIVITLQEIVKLLDQLVDDDDDAPPSAKLPDNAPELQ